MIKCKSKRDKQGLGNLYVQPLEQTPASQYAWDRRRQAVTAGQSLCPLSFDATGPDANDTSTPAHHPGCPPRRGPAPKPIVFPGLVDRHTKHQGRVQCTPQGGTTRRHFV